MALIKHFYSQVMNTPVTVLNKNLWGESFCCNKIKTEAFLENHGHTFVDIKKTSEKQNFRQTIFD